MSSRISPSCPLPLNGSEATPGPNSLTKTYYQVAGESRRCGERLAAGGRCEGRWRCFGCLFLMGKLDVVQRAVGAIAGQ